MDNWQLAQDALAICSGLTVDQLNAAAIAALDQYARGLLRGGEFLNGFIGAPDADRQKIGWCIIKHLAPLGGQPSSAI